MAYILDLPFQEGRPLFPIAEGAGDTVLIDYSTTHDSSPDRLVCMAAIGDADDEEERYHTERESQISTNQLTTDALPNVDAATSVARRERYCK